MANAKEFDKGNVKIIGLSVDELGKHEDSGPRTSKRPRARRRTIRSSATPTSRFRLRHAAGRHFPGDSGERTPADNQTVRNVFVVGPDKIA